MTALSLLIGTAGLDALTLVVITYFFICAPRPDIKPARNDGVGRPTDRSPGISLGLLGSPLGDCLLTGRPNRDRNYVSAYTAN